MLAVERERSILEVVNQHGVASVRHLADLCHVTETTIRRDLHRLEKYGQVQRIRGGVVRHPGRTDPAAAFRGPEDDAEQTPPDALILAPVQNQAAYTLREQALRNRIPLLAESAPFEGAVYLGPRNYEGSFSLGQWAGEYVRQHLATEAHVLDISADLPNIRSRSTGFADGLAASLKGGPRIISVNGGCLFSEAYYVARDALLLHPEINVIFGVNDDSVLAGLQAFCDLGRDTKKLLAVNVGGEGKTLFDTLIQGGPLKACLALFPEVVGQLAVDAVERAWAGENLGSEIITPSAIITAGNLRDYYALTKAGWQLRAEAVSALDFTAWSSSVPPTANKRISFVIHFRTHEWYLNVAAAMKKRGAEKGIEVSIVDVQQNLRAELRELQRLIGKVAASYVGEEEHIILDAGPYTDYMAQFLQNHANLTVITNSVGVWERLRSHPAIRLNLVGGEFHPESQSLVGRGAELLLRELRADKAFIVADGVTSSFGVSAPTLDQAAIRRAMIHAAREVVLLADHTVLGTDSRVRVAGLEKIHTVITDPGARIQDRIELNQRGIRVIVSGQFPNGSQSAEAQSA